mgnify:CR=1 FL=1
MFVTQRTDAYSIAMAHQQDGSGNADSRELVQALVEDLLVSLNVEDAPDAYANVLLQNMSQYVYPCV